MKTIYDYLNGHHAVDFFVSVTKREDGKPLHATIHPSGIVGDPFEFKLEPQAEPHKPQEK